jgi:hypothetical protein
MLTEHRGNLSTKKKFRLKFLFYFISFLFYWTFNLLMLHLFQFFLSFFLSSLSFSSSLFPTFSLFLTNHSSGFFYLLLILLPSLLSFCNPWQYQSPPQQLNYTSTHNKALLPCIPQISHLFSLSLHPPSPLSPLPLQLVLLPKFQPLCK